MSEKRGFCKIDGILWALQRNFTEKRPQLFSRLLTPKTAQILAFFSLFFSFLPTFLNSVFCPVILRSLHDVLSRGETIFNFYALLQPKIQDSSWQSANFSGQQSLAFGYGVMFSIGLRVAVLSHPI